MEGRCFGSSRQRLFAVASVRRPKPYPTCEHQLSAKLDISPSGAQSANIRRSSPIIDRKATNATGQKVFFCLSLGKHAPYRTRLYIRLRRGGHADFSHVCTARNPQVHLSTPRNQTGRRVSVGRPLWVPTSELFQVICRCLCHVNDCQSVPEPEKPNERRGAIKGRCRGVPRVVNNLYCRGDVRRACVPSGLQILYSTTSYSRTKNGVLPTFVFLVSFRHFGPTKLSSENQQDRSSNVPQHSQQSRTPETAPPPRV